MGSVRDPVISWGMVNYFSGVLRFQWRCCSADATLMTGADIMTTINHLNFYGVLMPQALAGVLVHPAYIYVGQPQEMVCKGVCKLFVEIHLTTTECHLPYGIKQCYLPPDTSEHTPPLPQPDRLVLDLPTI